MLGDSRDGLRDLAAVVACALVPIVGLGALGARAVANEAAATDRALAAQVEAEAVRLRARFERDLAGASERLARGEKCGLPFADDVAVDLDAPPSSATSLGATPPSAGEACLEDAARLRRSAGSARESARARLLAECPGVRSSRGRWLVPWLLLDRGPPDGELRAWLAAYGGVLDGSERGELAAALRMSPVPDAATWMPGGDSRVDADAQAAARSAVQSLRGRRLEPHEVARSGAGEALGLFVRLTDGAYVGCLVRPVTLSRAVAQGAFPVTRDTAVAVSPLVAPSALVPLGGELRLFVGLSGADVAARRTREGRLLLILGGGCSLAVALGALLLLFKRMREARRTSELRTDFVATVSHELRTPAASLQMLAELMATNGLPPDEQAEVTAAMVKETKRLAGTVDRLLSLRRMMAGKLGVDREEIDVVPLLNAASEEAALTPFARDYPASLNWSIDPGGLRLAIDNLLVNARKHGAPPFALRADVRGESLVIDVADGGRGLDAATVPRLFEPFERAGTKLSEATEGTGIGLALVRGIARAHGGEATWHDGFGDVLAGEPPLQPGRGTRFRITIPRPKAAIRRGAQ